jgi:hypothetical protein
MTDPLKPPIITPIDAAADAVDDDDKSGLPEHELRDAPDAGAEARTQGPLPADEDEPLEAPDDHDK